MRNIITLMFTIIIITSCTHHPKRRVYKPSKIKKVSLIPRHIRFSNCVERFLKYGKTVNECMNICKEAHGTREVNHDML